MALVQGAQQPVVLIERAEVHKSCKALEGVVNLFSDYCQAANATAQVEKRLAKALRDAAACKATTEPSFNALNATALIFETAADIDGKFGKFIERECENISNDLRRWFKKLAKEEKAHDDRILTVNNKIKAAGQAFEKKSKKKAADAAEEHAKYMNLLTVVGPEMAADKQNHATVITQRHNAAVCAVAASLARTADSDWGRVCESIRRCAPNIGAVSQWRAFCEGEWTGPVPADNAPADDAMSLKSGDTNTAPTPANDQRTWLPERDLAAFASIRTALQQGQASLPADSQPESPTAQMPQPPSYSNAQGLAAPPTETQLPSSQPTTPEPIVPLSRTTTQNSVLPTPAAAPPATTSPASAPTPTVKPVAKATNRPPSPPQIAAKPATMPMPSPGGATTKVASNDGPATPRLTPSASEESNKMPLTPPDVLADRAGTLEAKLGLGGSTARALSPPAWTASAADRSSTSLHDHDMPRSPPPNPRHPRGDYVDDHRVSPPNVRAHMTGIGAGMNMAPQQTGPSIPTQMTGPAAVGGGGGVGRRTSIDSTHSHVAAMRDRYAIPVPSPGSPPPPPRELPRLGTSVTDMATRYTPIDQPSPRRPGVSTPLLEQQQQRGVSLPDGQYGHGHQQRPYAGGRPQSVYGGQQQQQPPPQQQHPADGWTDNTERRKAYLQQELAALQDEEFRERERELERRQAELERERHRLATMRGADAGPGGAPGGGGGGGGPGGYASRGNSYTSSPTSYQQRPPSANGSTSYHGRSGSPTPQGSSLYGPTSYNTSSSSSASNSGHLAAPASNAGHSPNCGCWECSAKHYSNPPSPSQQTQPLPSPGTGTKKAGGGWVRRLSMPVIAGAFQSDSKKTPTGGMGVGPGSLTTPQESDERSTRRSFDRDGVGSFGQRRDNQGQGPYGSVNSMAGRR